VTEAVAGVWGGDRVGVRLSPRSDFNSMSDSDPRATFGHAALVLAPFGLAYLHIVEPVGSLPEGTAPLAPDLKEAFGGPLMLNGGYTRALAEAALARGEADLVSFGASFLANPDLPLRLARNAPLNAPDPATFYGGDQRGYTDYPALAGDLVAA
jgi:N-ethylmaleimide reductase